MFRGIYAATSAMLVQEKMLDVVANNLANVDTSGFRARVAVNQAFPEVLMDRVERYAVLDEDLNEELGERKFFPYVYGRVSIGTMPLANVMCDTAMTTHQGSVTFTDSPLDLTIDGDGFFVVENGNGDRFYTRQSSFKVDGTGSVMTPEGEYLVGEAGRITIGEDAVNVSVDRSGQVLVDGQIVGTPQVVTFANPSLLRQVGRSLLAATPDSGEPEPVAAPVIQSGLLERSNVEVVLEMTRMIEAQRCYEGAAKAVTSQDELTSRLFTSVGKPA